MGQVLATDGTVSGTITVTGQLPGFMGVVSTGSEAFFAPPGGGIYRTDGTLAGTSPLSGIPAGPINNLTVTSGGTLFFNGAYDSASQTAPLYASDGTSTNQVASLWIDSARHVSVGNRLLFLVPDGQAGLWSSDGTARGTVFLEPTEANDGAELTSAGPTAFFHFDDGVHGGELWKTDGTPAGTSLVKDINPYGSGLQDFNISQPQFVNGDVFFPATDGFHGVELWKSDGTAVGTVMVKDINTLPASSNPSSLSDVNGTLYFAATDDHGIQPWTSDGTTAGTQRLGVISTNDFFSPGPFIADGGKTFFMDRSGHELWITDGTAAGTSVVLPIDYTVHGVFDTNDFAVSGGDLYFFTEPLNGGSAELWTSDGTAAGTRMLKSLQGLPSHLLPVSGGGVEFLLDGGDTVAAWKSDGTAAGTTMLGTQQALGTEFAFISQVNILPNAAFMNGDYYLGAEIRPEPPVPPNPPPQFPPVYQVWRIGPSGNAKLIQVPLEINADAGPVNVNGTIAFIGDSKLYRTDGTAAGTTPIADLRQGGGSSVLDLPQLTVSGNLVYFAAGNGNGNQLWVSDGTAAGTHAVTSIPVVAEMTGADSLAAFVSGGQVWLSDGTANGTAKIADFGPTSSLNAPQDLTFSGNHLFFAATDVAHGRELWAADLSGAISGVVFNDVNHNGVRDPGEPGLAGVTIYLDANNNGMLDPGEISVVAGPDGNYQLTGLAGDAGTVRQVLPTGWRATTSDDGGAMTVHAAVASPGPIFGDVQISTVPMNFDYLLALAQHYNQPGTFATGDVTGDGQVNFDDLLLVAQNYGHPLPADAMTAAAEDNSLLLKKRKR